MKIIEKIKKGNLLESVIDNIEAKIKYRDEYIKYRHRQVIGYKRRMQYYRKLKKKILTPVLKEFEKTSEQQKTVNKTIWFCWFQGFENAPETVKECYKSIERLLVKEKGYKITVIDEKNMFDYVSFPEYIIEKYEKGIISKAHLSDILRTELLCRYGGLWIDSTVFLTGNGFMDFVEKTELFSPSKWLFFNAEVMSNENWFIYSVQNHDVLNLTLKCLYKYWEKYDILLDYFFWHIFFAMSAEYLEDDKIKDMPYLCAYSCDVLAQALTLKTDKNQIESIIYQSDIHKLSHKIDIDWKEIKEKYGEILGLN